MTRFFNVASLVILLALVSVPPLIAVHLPPLGSFWNEWLAGVLAILCWGFAWAAKESTLYISAALLPWAAWGIALSVSALFNKYFFSAAIFHYGIFWFVGLLVIFGVASLKRYFSFERVCLFLASAMMFSGLVQAMLGLARHFGLLKTYSIYLAPVGHERLAGLLNYPTTQGFSLWLSLVAATYLLLKRRISPVFCFVLEFIISVSIVATGDRASILYWAAVVSVFLILMLRARGQVLGDALRQWKKGITILTAVLLLGVFFLRPIVSVLSSAPEATAEPAKLTLQDGFERKRMLGIRWTEFKKAMVVLRQNPILGVGPGNYPYHGFILDNEIKNSVREGTVNSHTHNIFSMVMAEEGALGLLVLCLSLGAIAIWCWRLGVTAEAFFSTAIIALFFVFSNLEYPLWYLNFLTIFLIFFTLVSPAREFAIDNPRLKQSVAVLATAICMVVAVNIASGFSQISRIASQHIATARSVNTLSAMLGDHILGPYAGKIVEQATNPEVINARGQLKLANRLVHFMPMPVVLVTKALLLDFLGDKKEACALAVKTANSYPIALDQYKTIMMHYKSIPAAIKGQHPQELEPCFGKGVASWRTQGKN